MGVWGCGSFSVPGRGGGAPADDRGSTCADMRTLHRVGLIAVATVCIGGAALISHRSSTQGLQTIFIIFFYSHFVTLIFSESECSVLFYQLSSLGVSIA